MLQRSFCLIGLLLCMCLPSVTFGKIKKITKVVIDAGHGGSDPGARGKFSNEKDLTLAISLRLGKMIKDSLKDVQVIYTRTNDVYPSLKERHAIANREAADLFISIHINSTAGYKEKVPAGYHYVGKGKSRRKVQTYKYIHHRETKATGTETLVLGSIRNNQKKEAIGEYGEQIINEPGLMDENDPQTAIIIAQYTSAFLENSVSLAQHIQSEFSRQGRRDMGVKQQSLEVLAGTAMPAVLVECGFINNPEEETYLNSAEGLQEVSYAIFAGIRKYKREVERSIN